MAIDRESVKTFALAHPVLVKVGCWLINKAPWRLRVRGRGGNTVIASSLWCHGVRIEISGRNNHVEIGPLSTLKKCTILVNGDNNRIVLGQGTFFEETHLLADGDNNAITVGERTNIYGISHLTAMEGTNLVVGERCLISYKTELRTGDSHSIFDAQQQRINPSESIAVGNHVWIGAAVNVLKGALISDECVVGLGSVVTRMHTERNCLLLGSPAAEIKKDIYWE